MIVKQCQLKEARRLVQVANEGDLTTYDAKRQRKNEILRDTKELAAEKRLAMSSSAPRRASTAANIPSTTLQRRASTTALVADLAVKHLLRIEMRQVGPRDETKMRGGSACGLTPCCSTFLKGFHPVTIKMAKNQNLSLNPSRSRWRPASCAASPTRTKAANPRQTPAEPKKPQNFSSEAPV